MSKTLSADEKFALERFDGMSHEDVYALLREEDITCTQDMAFLDLLRFEYYLPPLIKHIKGLQNCGDLTAIKSLVVTRYTVQSKDAHDSASLLKIVKLIHEIEESLDCKNRRDSFCPGYDGVVRRLQGT